MKSNITLEVLNKVSAEFPGTKEFIDQKLEENVLKKIHQ